jgi:small subunit ribosomal protein S13
VALLPVNIPTNKRVEIALRYIMASDRQCQGHLRQSRHRVEPARQDLTETEVIQIREAIDRDYVVEAT